MSARVNGNVANYLSRSSDLLDYNSAYTIALWVRPETVSGADNIIVLSHLTSTAYDSLSMSGGVLGIAGANGSFPAGTTGSTLSAGVYRHVALVRVASNDLRLYLDGTLDATHTTNIAGRTALQRMLLGVWQSAGLGASDPYDGRYAYGKAWSVALSAAEIQQEMRSIRPRKLASLYGFWPLRPGATERVKDYSGNGRDWTANGTVTDEDPPPVSWGGRSGRRSPSSTAYTETGSATSAASASGADALATSNSGSATSTATASGAEALSTAETGSATSAATASGTDALAAVDAGSGVSAASATGADSFSGANLYVETGGAASTASASGTDQTAWIDSGSAIGISVGGGADALVMVDSGSAASGSTASGADALVMVDVGGGVLIAIGSGTGGPLILIPLLVHTASVPIQARTRAVSADPRRATIAADNRTLSI